MVDRVDRPVAGAAVVVEDHQRRTGGVGVGDTRYGVGQTSSAPDTTATPGRRASPWPRPRRRRPPSAHAVSGRRRCRRRPTRRPGKRPLLRVGRKRPAHRGGAASRRRPTRRSSRSSPPLPRRPSCRVNGSLVRPICQARPEARPDTLGEAMSLDLTWQPSLLDAGPEPTIDETFAGAERISLDRRSWIERVPGWVCGLRRARSPSFWRRPTGVSARGRCGTTRCSNPGSRRGGGPSRGSRSSRRSWSGCARRCPPATGSSSTPWA